jgi:release factor glutamine methyltransferase
MPTSAQTIRIAARQLSAAGIDDARLEAQLLLSHAAGMSKSSMLARLNEPVPAAVCERLENLIERRLGREPLAYILGYREFYGREFLVSPAVLIPRPETELIVDDARNLLSSTPESLIIDIGTGSGALGLTLLAESPLATLLATDISAEALEVAVQNAERLNVADRASFVLGDLTSMLNRPGHRTVVVANLPYVAEDDRAYLQPEVRDWEPAGALFSGPDGLDLVGRLLGDLPRLLKEGDVAYLEIGLGQRTAVAQISHQIGARKFTFIKESRGSAALDNQRAVERVVKLEF